jgi:hypothetical protein
VTRLLALALACTLVAAGAAVAEGKRPQRQESAAKRSAPARACARPAKRVERRPAKRAHRRPAKRPHRRAMRCARVLHALTPRPPGERLTALPDPTPLKLVAPGSPPAGDGAPGTPAPPPPPAIRFVSVRALEYSFTLSRPLVNAGAVTIELRNNGEDPHNLIVSPDDGSHTPLASWPDTGPGAYLRQSVALAPGRYQLWCSLLDHEARGMTADLVVE